GDLTRVALVCPLKAEHRTGRIGVLVSGEDFHLSELSWGDEVQVDPTPPPEPDPPSGVIRAWEVSDAFAEAEIARAHSEPRSWTPIESEPGGLLDLGRVQGINGDRNTVLARTAIRTDAARTQALQLGFSDRALVYLNGVPLYHGEDTYR